MNITISTVTPVYHGADTLKELVQELDVYRIQLIETNSPMRLIESIFVDDGSTDGSSDVLDKLSKEFDWVRVITLSRNFGQHPATIAGILYTSGDWVATLDEDLQHRPSYLNDLLCVAILEKCDIVYANPERPVHESFFRDFSSRAIKATLAVLTKNKFMTLFNSFRLIRGGIARAASAVSIDQTYFDVALTWFTTRIGSLKLPLKDVRYITSAKSGYSFWSLLSHARKLLQSSNVKFIRFGAIMGILTMLLGILAAITTILIKLLYPGLITAQGWASVVIITSLLGGLNAFLIGLVLENLSVVLMQSHGKPKFFEVDRASDKKLDEWFKKNDLV